jgi:hypothetical protein
MNNVLLQYFVDKLKSSAACRDSLVGMGCKIRSLSSSRGKRFSLLRNVHTGSESPSLLRNGYRRSFRGSKRPGHDVDHSSPYNVEVKNEWSCTSTPPIRLHGVDRDSFTFLVSIASSRTETRNPLTTSHTNKAI